jgi:hypothetical protein
MKFYVLDSDSRLGVYFLIALTSLGFMLLLGQASNVSEYFKIIAPSGLMIFVAVIALFDRYIWKWRYINSLVGIPVLEGIWEGVLKREAANGNIVERKVDLIITQNWRKMSLVFSGENSVSQAQLITLYNENKNYVNVKWVYFASDKSGKENANLYGEGTTDLALSISNDKKTLVGSYYSSKLKKGRISLEYKGKSNEQ